MEVTRTIGNNSVKVVGENILDVFKELSTAEDVFGALVAPCDNEQGYTDNVRLVVREVTDSKNPKKVYTYFEAWCQEAPYRKLQFGQRQDGGLFPKRKDAEGNPIGINGWATMRELMENREEKEEAPKSKKEKQLAF